MDTPASLTPLKDSTEMRSAFNRLMEYARLQERRNTLLSELAGLEAQMADLTVRADAQKLIDALIKVGVDFTIDSLENRV